MRTELLTPAASSELPALGHIRQANVKPPRAMQVACCQLIGFARADWTGCDTARLSRRRTLTLGLGSATISRQFEMAEPGLSKGSRWSRRRVDAARVSNARTYTRGR